MNKILFGLIFTVSFILAFGAMTAGAKQQEFSKTICHHTPGNDVTLTFHTQQAYSGHLGKPHSRSTYDTDGACVVLTPTPTVELTLTPTPTEEVTPTPTEEITPTPTEEVTPTPTEEVTPTPQQLTGGGNPPTFAGSSTEAPQCGDWVPGRIANIYVETGIPNDGKLEVRWLSEEPKGNRAHIRYTEGNGENWQYALLNTENDGVEVIGDLKNGVHYNFQVAQVNGCSVGAWSKTYDPLP